MLKRLALDGHTLGLPRKCLIPKCLHEPRGTDVGKVSCSRCKKGAALWNALPLIRTYIFTSFKFHAVQFDEKTHLQ